MTDRVGIVIVSHSVKIAEGTADMVRQMVGDDLPLAFAGGDPGGGLGTDVGAIMAAFEAAWSDAGVAVFCDLGGAVTNSEMAIEMFDPALAAKIAIVDAPLVEGAVIGGAEAWGGASIEKVMAAAAHAGGRGAEHGATTAGADKMAEGSAFMTHDVGLHARPSVAVTKLAKVFSAKAEMAANPAGPWVDASSIVKVMAMKVPKDTRLYFRASGSDAHDAVAGLVALVENDFAADA